MLNKNILENDLKSSLKATILESAQKNSSETDLNKAVENLANAIAKSVAEKVDVYVKTAQVNVNVLAGQIQVVGSPSAQANAVPILLSGNLT